jgi:hypothetical protein
VAVVLALPALTAGVARGAALPAFAGTRVVTARGNGGVALYLPRDAALDMRDREAKDHAVTIARRGGTYAFVGLSEPDACRRYADPETRMCMAVHGYDFGALRRPGMPDLWAQDVVTLDPPTLGRGRIEVYVLTDGEVTLTVRLKGMTGTRRVRADRKVSGLMRELPRTCVAPCDDVAFGGVAYDVGKAGFVASVALAAREVDSGTATPLGPLAPGTQTADSCIYRAPASADPARHPFGCDTGGDPLSTAGTALNAVTWAYPYGSVAGWRNYDYGGTGSVYVGFHGAVAGPTGAWRALAGYGVWVSDGLR